MLEPCSVEINLKGQKIGKAEQMLLESWRLKRGYEGAYDAA
jgi:hypothetical protein